MKKKDKPVKIELPYEDALKAFMRTPPPKRKKKPKADAKKIKNDLQKMDALRARLENKKKPK